MTCSEVLRDVLRLKKTAVQQVVKMNNLQGLSIEYQSYYIIVM